VENLWITVGNSLLSVGKARQAPYLPGAQIKIFGLGGVLSTEKRCLPTAYPQGGFLYKGVEQDFYWLWGLSPQKSLWLLLLPLYIEILSTHEHFQVGTGVPDFQDFK
jgi:hypothetical protein